MNIEENNILWTISCAMYFQYFKKAVQLTMNLKYDICKYDILSKYKSKSNVNDFKISNG